MTSHAPVMLPGTVGDGEPHLAYYDRDSHLSFVWTGHLTDPIHVQHGGYGEPTVALIDPAPLYPAGHALPAEVVAWFRNVCDTWNARWDGEEGRIETDHRLAGGPLVCTNDRPHDPGDGCIHESTTGSWVDDRHDDGGHG